MARIRGQVVDVLLGQNRISGGSIERDEKDWHVNPTGIDPSHAVITTTPVQKCDIT
jgi:hypothetical protein